MRIKYKTPYRKDKAHLTPEYRAWCRMKDRYYNPNYKGYATYGGRGIVVCDKWVNDYDAFLRDVGPRPSPNHTIDRINNNGNYESGNVRWGTWQQQARNRGVRRTNTSGTTGIHKDKRRDKWIVTITTNYKTRCVGSFSELENAIKARADALLDWE